MLCGWDIRPLVSHVTRHMFRVSARHSRGVENVATLFLLIEETIPPTLSTEAICEVGL